MGLPAMRAADRGGRVMGEYKPGMIDRMRQTVAGWLFLLAGRVHWSYDVWLDEAPLRRRTAIKHGMFSDDE